MSTIVTTGDITLTPYNDGHERGGYVDAHAIVDAAEYSDSIKLFPVSLVIFEWHVTTTLTGAATNLKIRGRTARSKALHATTWNSFYLDSTDLDPNGVNIAMMNATVKDAGDALQVAVHPHSNSNDSGNGDRIVGMDEVVINHGAGITAGVVSMRIRVFDFANYPGLK